jgi:putative membrane protein
MRFRNFVHIAICLMAVDMLASCSSDKSDRAHNYTANSGSFVKQAAMGNHMEVVTSEIALDKSQDPAVRSFASRMIQDHVKAEGDLRNAVAAAKVNPSYVTNDFDAKNQAIINGLRKASAVDFDRQYMDIQRQAHADTVSMFRNYRDNGMNRSLRDFAAETLPTLESHEHEAYDIRVR